MDESIISIILLLLGLSLIVAEVFLPSGGLLSLFSVVLVAGSYYFAWQEWHETAPSIFWGFVVLSIGLAPATIIGAFYLLPKTPFGKKVLLVAPDIDEVTPFGREREHLDALVGRQGVTAGLLNPGGLVDVDGERLHCESEGTIIDSGVRVVISGHRGNSLLVRELQDSDPVEPPKDPADASGQDLDFGVADK